MARRSRAGGVLPLPAWGPAELVAALPPGPVAVLDGLTAAGRPAALVAWAPAAGAGDLDAALALPAAGVPLPPGAPALLGAAVGALAWNGAAHFWLPGAAALFDPGGGKLWYRGQLPPGLAAGGRPPGPAPAAGPGRPAPARPLWDREGFCAAVGAAQARMAAGAVRKVVLSVPFAAPCALPPLAVFRRLAAARPPGLRFLLDAGAARWALAGVSPETLVTLAGRRAELHPLAGTRPDRPGMAAELLASDKDRAEHAVAVEQARADLLAVCDPGAVTAAAFMAVERHPGLVHLASHLAGTLRAGAGPADLVRACFPAGTVSGVPRPAATALIAELEPRPRGWYAGAVGALLPGGGVQLWLTIRSVLLAGGEALVQTGAGVVPASRAGDEWAECAAKAARTLAAVEAEVMPA